MNLIFNSADHAMHINAKELLDANKIRYSVLDDDASKLRFRIAQDKVQEFQMNLVNNVFGSQIAGTFFVEE